MSKPKIKIQRADLCYNRSETSVTIQHIKQ